MPRPFLKSILLACTLSVCTTAYAQSAKPSTKSSTNTSQGASQLSNPATERKINDLLRKMTLEEKVGQLVQYSAGQPTGPGTGRTDYEDMLSKGQVGALFNISTAKEVNAMQKIAVEKSRLHIPIIFGLDVIHGFRTEFPIPLGLSATWDPQLVERAMRIAGRESAASGVRWTFSPMVDIARDARWGRMAEGAGEDPFLGSAMARAYVRGYQGKSLSDPDSIAACAKHYVGYGAAEGGRDYNTTDISEHTLRQIYLPPFKAAVDAGTATIMSAFNSLDGVPSSANPFTLKQILRKEWGFKGIVDSDWTSVGELIAHSIAIDGSAAARRAFLGGVDMDMVSSLYHDHLADLVKSGVVPVADIDESVRRILRVKFALGLFDRPYTDESKESAAMLRPESLQVAREAAEKSFVLLKNSAPSGGSPILPLSGNEKSVALIGPLADDAANMLGAWGAKGSPDDVVTLRAALVQKLGAEKVHYVKGTEIIGGSDAQIADAVNAAQQSDVVLLALGEDGPAMTGEATSVAHLNLPGLQEKLLEAVAGTGKPVVLILFHGRPLTIPFASEHVPAILAAWFPGAQAGPALVRTLYGAANPAGRLTVSWPRTVGQEPLYYNALPTGRPAGTHDLSHPPTGEDKYVSRYIDEQNSPQYAFGFGLSYSTFRYGQPQLSTTQLSAKKLNADLTGTGAALTVTADVTNTSSRPGDEVVQLYIRFQGTSVSTPVRELKGFERVTFAAGETKKITFQLPAETFAFWNEQNKFAAEPASMTVWVSPNSTEGSEAKLSIVP